MITLFSVLLLCFGCSEKTPSVKESQQRDHENAVYFWKTRFELGDEEMAFLREYSIKRIYLKYFDVDYENNPVSEEEGIVPVSTASFVSCRPKEIEIVPTVFITVKALVYIRDNKLITDSAWKIVRRILNMSSYNSMGSVREVQLDCDWTESTQETYFALCRAVKGLLNKDNIITSSTIRLHQLRLPAPPVDRGVLMLYNTGAMRDLSTKNSILDIEDVKLYLKGTPVKYALPLDFAYPTYSWGLWFRDHEFMGILHTNDYSDVSRYTASGEDGISFLVHKEHILEGHRLIPGDVIRLETSDTNSIKETASLVSAAFPGTHSNIIYHSTARTSNNTAKMKSRIFLVTSILLLTLSVKVFACGPWYYDPQTYLMYRPYSYPSEEWEYNTGAKENCLLWQKQCKTSATTDDIYQIVYKTNLEDLKGLLNHSFKARKLSKSNAFARTLWNDREAAELLVLAKECEIARSDLNSPWYYPATKNERPCGLDQIASKAGDYKGERFLNRYALQRIRALFSLREYDECLNYWNDVSASLADDINKRMAERYIAGAYFRIGETETAKDYYLKLRDTDGLYFCFSDGQTPWEEVLYQYAPDCKELREWMSSKIKYEEHLFYDTYDDYWKEGSVPGEDAEKCKELARFCARIASEGRVKDPDFWYYSQAYLMFMAGKPAEASSLLSKASKSSGSQEMKDNIRVFSLYMDSVLKPWSLSYENEMIEGLKWLDGMIVSHLDEAKRETIESGVYKMGINLSYYYWNDMMRKIVLSSIVPKLLNNHRETSAIRFTNMADNRLLNLVGKSRVWYQDKDSKEWVEEDLTISQVRTGRLFNEHDYSNALFELIDTLDVVHLERYVASLDKAGTKAESFLDKRSYTEKAFFQEVIGTKHIREMRYKDAVRWLSMLPKSFQTRLNTYKEGYLNLDPFAQSKQKMRSNNEYKLAFAKKMADLESSIANEKNTSERARKTALYATGMRNSVSICWGMSFYRKSVADIDTEYFGSTYFSRKQEVVFSKSEKLFQQAIRNCPDRETAASILYELGNMKTVAERFPETKSASIIKGECDKLVDYHLEKRTHYIESYGNGPYEFERNAATTMR